MGGQAGGTRTWLRAHAYAHYYGKHLPKFDEWKLLRKQFAYAQGSACLASKSHRRGL
jgi:hypothetical protein